MNSKMVATQNARKFIVVFQICVLLLVASCSKSDNLETINNENPNVNELDIVYKDIEPDFMSKNIGDFYDLDLNNDGTIDFFISSFISSDYEWLVIEAPDLNSSNGCISIEPWYDVALPLSIGTEITNPNNQGFYSNGAYIATGYCFLAQESCDYDWKDKNDKYLGLRFLVNGQTHYGWARLDVTSASNWVIKDYAYNATPNLPILAGQKD